MPLPITAPVAPPAAGTSRASPTLDDVRRDLRAQILRYAQGFSDATAMDDPANKATIDKAFADAAALLSIPDDKTALEIFFKQEFDLTKAFKGKGAVDHLDTYVTERRKAHGEPVPPTAVVHETKELEDYYAQLLPYVPAADKDAFTAEFEALRKNGFTRELSGRYGRYTTFTSNALQLVTALTWHDRLGAPSWPYRLRFTACSPHAVDQYTPAERTNETGWRMANDALLGSAILAYKLTTPTGDPHAAPDPGRVPVVESGLDLFDLAAGPRTLMYFGNIVGGLTWADTAADLAEQSLDDVVLNAPSFRTDPKPGWFTGSVPKLAVDTLKLVQVSALRADAQAEIDRTKRLTTGPDNFSAAPEAELELWKINNSKRYEEMLKQHREANPEASEDEIQGKAEDDIAKIIASADRGGNEALGATKVAMDHAVFGRTTAAYLNTAFHRDLVLLKEKNLTSPVPYIIAAGGQVLVNQVPTLVNTGSGNLSQLIHDSLSEGMAIGSLIIVKDHPELIPSMAKAHNLVGGASMYPDYFLRTLEHDKFDETNLPGAGGAQAAFIFGGLGMAADGLNQYSTGVDHGAMLKRGVETKQWQYFAPLAVGTGAHILRKGRFFALTSTSTPDVKGLTKEEVEESQAPYGEVNGLTHLAEWLSPAFYGLGILIGYKTAPDASSPTGSAPIITLGGNGGIVGGQVGDVKWNANMAPSGFIFSGTF